MNVCKFIKEFDTDSIVSRCSVVIILDESQEEPVGDGVSVIVLLYSALIGEDVDASFFKLSSLSPKLIRFIDF